MTPAATTRPDVFLSYAREDIAIARDIVAALDARGIEVSLDLTHIAPGEDYPSRLDDLLRSSAKVVFLATRDSLISAACAHERALARASGIPVLPVLVPDLPGSALPADLRQINYLRMADGPARADTLARLAGAVMTDLPWERARAEYGRMAARSPAAILRGRADVAEAEEWLIRRPRTAVAVADDIREMILHSRRHLTRLARAAVALLALVTLSLGALAATALDRSQRLGRLNGTLLAAEAERLAGELRTDAALLVMLEATDRAGPDSAGRIGAAFARVLDRPERERRFVIPGDATILERDNALYYRTGTQDELFRLDLELGPVRADVLPEVADSARARAATAGLDLVTRHYMTSGGDETHVDLFAQGDRAAGHEALAGIVVSSQQTAPSMFADLGGERITLAMADIDSVVVWRARGTSVEETRLPFAHVIAHAVALDHNTIMAVEPESREVPPAPRRVTILTLSAPQDRWIADRFDTADPVQAWPVTCLVTDPPDWGTWRWLDTSRVEFAAGNIAVLPDEMAQDLHERLLFSRQVLWPDEPYPCLYFTADGGWFNVSTQQGHGVYRTVDGAHLFTLPIARHAPFALTGTVGEALVSTDRRTVERLTLGPDGWTRTPVLQAPHFVVGMFLHPDQDLLLLTLLLGRGMVEVRAWSLADWREVARLGENYKFASPQLVGAGGVSIPELGTLIVPVTPDQGRVRAVAALSPGCRPERADDWRSSPCWPAELG